MRLKSNLSSICSVQNVVSPFKACESSGQRIEAARSKSVVWRADDNSPTPATTYFQCTSMLVFLLFEDNCRWVWPLLFIFEVILTYCTSIALSLHVKHSWVTLKDRCKQRHESPLPLVIKKAFFLGTFWQQMVSITVLVLDTHVQVQGNRCNSSFVCITYDKIRQSVRWWKKKEKWNIYCSRDQDEHVFICWLSNNAELVTSATLSIGFFLQQSNEISYELCSFKLIGLCLEQDNVFSLICLLFCSQSYILVTLVISDTDSWQTSQAVCLCH